MDAGKLRFKQSHLIENHENRQRSEDESRHDRHARCIRESFWPGNIAARPRSELACVGMGRGSKTNFKFHDRRGTRPFLYPTLLLRRRAVHHNTTNSDAKTRSNRSIEQHPASFCGRGAVPCSTDVRAGKKSRRDGDERIWASGAPGHVADPTELDRGNVLGTEFRAGIEKVRRNITLIVINHSKVLFMTMNAVVISVCFPCTLWR